jgi:hypothetical protein
MLHPGTSRISPEDEEKLPPCGRRLWIHTPKGSRFVCGPAVGEYGNQDVVVADCLACSAQTPVKKMPTTKSPRNMLAEARLENGILIYPKIEGQGPPKVPGGFRPSDSDPWVLIPNIVNCSHLKLVFLNDESCNCKRVKPYCTKYLKELEIGVCDACPYKDGGKPVTQETYNPIAGAAQTLRQPGGGINKVRRWTIESNGTIVYEREEGFDEDPRDINGYQRDPNNPYRFIPLWPKCFMRHSVGIQYPLCGCLDIIMRCNNPDAKKFQDRVKLEDCQSCPVRKE